MSLACFQLGACPYRRRLWGCGVSLPAHVQPQVGSADSPRLTASHTSMCPPPAQRGTALCQRTHRRVPGRQGTQSFLRCLNRWGHALPAEVPMSRDSKSQSCLRGYSSPLPRKGNDNFSNIAVTTPVVAQTAWFFPCAQSRLMCTVTPRGTTRVTPSYRRETSTTT